MAEPTVQVPVSLIEEILRSAEFTDVLGHIKEPLRALLSQPTPTAELIACPHWEPGRITMRKRCTACAANTEPPRIEDMEPGTTFWARTLYGALSGAERFWMVADARGYVIGTAMHYLPGAHVDPSTIRDVTPPKDAA